MGEGCAALGRRLHREVDDGYAADREGSGRRLCCWVERPLAVLLGGTTARCAAGRNDRCAVRRKRRYWVGESETAGWTGEALLGERKLDDGCTAWRERWKVVTLIVARGLGCWVAERWMTAALLGGMTAALLGGKEVTTVNC